MKTLLLLLCGLSLCGAEQIPIPAFATRGIPMGRYEAGDVVSVEYLKGVWKRRFDNAEDSPDTTQWSEIRVVIYHEDSSLRRTIIARPQNTRGNAWLMVVKNPGQYYIRMNEPREEGIGVVFYEIGKVKVIKEGK